MTSDTKPSLRAILALPVIKRVGNADIEIKPMGWYQGAKALEPLLPVLAELPLLGAAAADTTEAWTTAVLAYRDEINAFVAAAGNFEPEEVRQLPPAEMLQLVMALVEVNADFFVQALPALADLFGRRMLQMVERVGPALLQMQETMQASSSRAQEILATMKPASPTSSSA
jgi:hypothetical protein